MIAPEPEVTAVLTALCCHGDDDGGGGGRALHEHGDEHTDHEPADRVTQQGILPEDPPRSLP